MAYSSSLDYKVEEDEEGAKFAAGAGGGAVAAGIGLGAIYLLAGPVGWTVGAASLAAGAIAGGVSGKDARSREEAFGKGVVAVGKAAAAATAAVGSIQAARKVQGHYQENKDRHLTDCEKHAAFASAAYCTPDKRQSALHNAGVQSRNWKYDEQQSNNHTAVYHNPYTNQTEIAFRGTVDRSDLCTDAAIVVGAERLTQRYQESEQITKAAREKYSNSETVVTGHSLGGGIADHVGRQLGLPSKQFNPGKTGAMKDNKILEKKAVDSNTWRTFADPVSSLHAAVPGDTKVQHIRQKTRNPHSMENFTRYGDVAHW